MSSEVLFHIFLIAACIGWVLGDMTGYVALWFFGYYRIEKYWYGLTAAIVFFIGACAAYRIIQLMLHL